MGIVDIVGISDTKIKINLGYKMMLKDTRHVVDLRLNFLSVGRLDDEGFESRFGRGLLKQMKGSLVDAFGMKSNTLYKLATQGYVGQLNAVEKDFSMEFWHCRQGHMSEKGLQAL